MKTRRPRAPEPAPCPACGVRYADWRGYYPGGFRGSLSCRKASAWEDHVTHCEDYPATAADFDPSMFGTLDPNAELAAYVESIPDDSEEAYSWGAPMDEPAPAAPVRPALPVLGPFDAVPWL